jgi:2,3-diaminopropionate biosynthesis protein SbnA
MEVGGALRTIFMKLEGRTPSGSSKYRTAWFLLRDLERRGRLTASSIVVESSSGNLGVALAMLCRERGLPFVAVIDPKTSEENVARLRFLGAAIERIHAADGDGGYLSSRLRAVEQLCRSCVRYVWPDQYNNPANSLAHYMTTAPDIHRQSPRPIDLILVPVSTGGTLSGIARYFRSASPHTSVVAVDVVGSAALGGRPGPRLLTGIGSARRASLVTAEDYDRIHWISDHRALRFCRSVAAATGLKLGGSSGAVLAACAEELGAYPSFECAVCLCPDLGSNYESTIYNDDWLRQAGIENLDLNALPRMSCGSVGAAAIC